MMNLTDDGDAINNESIYEDLVLNIDEITQ